MAMTRRRLLESLACGAAMVAAPLGGWLYAGRARAARDWRHSLEAIGAAYVRQHHSPRLTARRASRNVTVNAALGHLGASRSTAEALLASGQGPRLAACVRDDFDRGRTTEVDGWVLATTEVAVALVAWARRAA